MKKSILLLAVALGSFSWTVASAQETVPNDNFVNSHLKAEKNDFTAELGLQGGLNNLNLTLNEGAALLRGRYFWSDKWAARLGLSANVHKNTQNFYSPIHTNGEGTEVTSTSNVMINLGVERHFQGTNHLSPYVGADLLWGVAGQKTTLTNTDGTTYVANVTAEQKGPGSLSFGARVLFGADYYFVKHVYIGAEAGLGFLYTHEGKTTTTVSGGGMSQNITEDSKGHSFDLNPNVITGVRIGFVF